MRPKRERRALAEVLAAEISINMQLLAGAHQLASPTKVPPDIHFSTVVYESVLEKVGELPPDMVGEIVFLYGYFDELNEHPRMYTNLLAQLRELPDDSKHRLQIERELTTCAKVFNSYVEKTINRVNLVQPHLLKAAFPWWSARRYQRRPSLQLDMEEVAHRIVKSKAERDALAAKIERRDKSQ